MYNIKHEYGSDSVPNISSTTKRKLFDEEVLEDRVDMRVMTNIVGDTYDVSTAEFANWLLGPGKFTDGHKKVLREPKVILDSIINNKHTSKKEARRLIVPCFQASDVDGELKIVKLSVPGLYTTLYIGSIPIPGRVAGLKLLRKKHLPRLYYMKVNWLNITHFSSTMLKEKTRIMLSRMST